LNLSKQRASTGAVKLENIQISQTQIADFCRRHRIRWLALFGSALRDDFGPESDVDILVEFEPQARLGLMAYASIQRELSELLQRPVDLVTRDGLKPLIRQAVLEDAEVIYAA
jgi:predicted nucleotidyltransferase